MPYHKVPHTTTPYHNVLHSKLLRATKYDTVLLCTIAYHSILESTTQNSARRGLGHSKRNYRALKHPVHCAENPWNLKFAFRYSFGRSTAESCEGPSSKMKTCRSKVFLLEQRSQKCMKRITDARGSSRQIKKHHLTTVSGIR